MTTKQQREIARETYQKLLARLDPKIAKVIEHPTEDPGILCKGEPGRVHIRILPVKAELRPKNFWGRRRCYYEILIGPYPTGSGVCLGEVQFFRYANQPKSNGKKFTRDVLAILNNVMTTAPKGFIFNTPNHDGKFHFQRHYYARDFRNYPCKIAASDLAWLIGKTLTAFQKLYER